MRTEAVMEHPTTENLAALLYERLTADQAEPILKHLDECAECEGRLEQMEPAFGDYRQFRETAAPVPVAWPDLAPRMRRLDSERRAQVIPIRSNRPAWIGMTAAAALVVVLLLWPAGKGSEARAEVLLAQARKAPRAGTAHKRLQVRTATRSFVRPAITKGDDPVRAEFEAAHYDWNDPLSASAYSDWKDRLNKPSVKVTEEKQRAVIDTVATQGLLIEGVLTIASADMSVMSAKFRFADEEWVEVTAVPDLIGEASLPAPAIVRPAVQADNGHEIPLPVRELRVWSAIDGLNLASGTPISVEADGSRIVVTAYSLNPAQDEELRASLARIPNVRLRTESLTQDVNDTRESAITMSEAILAGAHFLKKLDERFSDEVVSSFDVADRSDLATMRKKHAAQLKRDVEALRFELAKTHSIPGSAANVSASSEALVASAEVVDRLVTSLYAGTAGSVAGWPQLIEEFSRLERISQTYVRSVESSQ